MMIGKPQDRKDHCGNARTVKMTIDRRTHKEATPVESSVEDEILQALTEFTEALEKGDVAKRFNCRQVKLNLEPTAYNPELVKKTRDLLNISQPLFARFLGVSARTVKSWEQGDNEPHPMACRFMDEIRRNPKYWTNRLKEITVKKLYHRDSQRGSR
jgi:putative transcriptional regulator